MSKDFTDFRLFSVIFAKKPAAQARGEATGGEREGNMEVSRQSCAR
jgi:hypothetical protein